MKYKKVETMSRILNPFQNFNNSIKGYSYENQGIYLMGLKK